MNMAKESAAEAKNALQTPDVAAKETATKKSDSKSKDSKPKKNVFQKITRFFKDLKSEFKKIVWPSKKQVLNNTAVVLVFMAITGVALWILDFIFIQGFGLLF